MKMDQINLRKGNAKITNYREIRMGENHGGRERKSTITMAITMAFSIVLGLLRSNPFYVGRALLFIQVVFIG